MLKPPAIVAAGLAPKLALLHAMLEHRSLNSAAEAAGVPPPTAMRWLISLNESVGVALTARVGRHVELTPAGVELAESAGQVLQALSLAASHAVEAASSNHGHIVFGFLRSLSSTRAPSLVHGFHAVKPGIRFSLVQGSHQELAAKLHRAEIDVALTTVGIADPNLTTLELFNEPLVAVVPNTHPFAQRREVDIADCAREALVGLREPHATRAWVDQLFTEIGAQPNYAFETDEVETVRGLAAAGIGIALLPNRAAEPVPGSVEVPVTPPTFRHIGLATAAQRPVPPAAQHFVDWAATQSELNESVASPRLIKIPHPPASVPPNRQPAARPILDEAAS